MIFKKLIKWCLIYMFIIFVTVVFLFFSRYDDIVYNILPKIIKNGRHIEEDN
jgi:hypothetical protein